MKLPLIYRALFIILLPLTCAASEPTVDELRSCTMFSDEDEFVDRVRATTFNVACSSSRWFDHLFGDDKAFDGSRVHGWINLGLDLDTAEGVKPRARMSLKTDLPNVNNRFNLVLGRMNLEEFVSNTQSEGTTGRTSGFKSTEDDEDSWMLGLGYNKTRKNGVVFDSGVGARLRSSGIMPYVKAQRFQQIELSHDQLFTNQQTIFWRRDEGYGFSTDLKYEKILSDVRTAVFFPAVKYSSDDDRWEWVARLQLYHFLNERAALKYTTYIRDNRSDTDEGLNNELGLEIDYRRRFMREWLYLVPTVTFSWEKRDGNFDFEPELFLGLRFEMAFDKNVNQYYRKSNRSR